MTKKHDYMPFFGHLWRTGTEDVHSDFRGPYIDLCWIIFNEGGRVPNIPDALARHARLGNKKFERFWRDCKHKFIIDGDLVGHRKVDEVLKDLSELSEKRKNAGRRGGQKTQQKQRRRSSKAKATKTESFSSPLKERTKTYGDENSSDNDSEGQEPDASAPARMSGEGLASEPLPEAAQIILRRMADDHRASIHEVRDFAKSIIGFASQRFILDPDQAESHPKRLIDALECAGGKLQSQPQQNFKVIEGGNR